MITRTLLRSLRNDLPMAFTIRQLGDKAPYSKSVEGRFRFQCPHCRETLAVVNPQNNLAHCFGCGRNINNIDLLVAIGYDFRGAAALLQQWLRLHNVEKDGPETPFPQPKSSPKRDHGAAPIGSILRQESGNRAAHR